MQIEEHQLEFNFAPVESVAFWQVLGAYMLGDIQLTFQQILEQSHEKTNRVNPN